MGRRAGTEVGAEGGGQDEDRNVRDKITSAEPGSHIEKEKKETKTQKKNDYIKSADAVRGEASLVGLMGTEVVRRWHRDFFNVRLHPSTQSRPPRPNLIWLTTTALTSEREGKQCKSGPWRTGRRRGSAGRGGRQEPGLMQVRLRAGGWLVGEEMGDSVREG